MCVYCQEDPSCEHERDSCAASRGEFCPECRHRTAVMKTYTPKPSFPMIQPGRSRKRKPAEHDRQSQSPVSQIAQTEKLAEKLEIHLLFYVNLVSES